MKVELDKIVEKQFTDICMYHSVSESLRLALYQMLMRDQELKDRLRASLDLETARGDEAERLLIEVYKDIEAINKKLEIVAKEVH